MRNLILALSFAILSSSCSSTYYYLATLNTENTQVRKVEDGYFFSENDSLAIVYSFNGENALVSITVSNKLDQMLHIDWQKSAIVLNDEAFSYAGEEIKFKGRTSGTGIAYNSGIWGGQHQSYKGKTEGIFKYPINLTIIPPKSKVINTPLSLDKITFENIEKDKYHKFLMLDKDNETIMVDRADFSVQDTPLHVKSYLTMYYKESTPFVIRQDFYVENIMKTRSLLPKKIPEEVTQRGDFFYVKIKK